MAQAAIGQPALRRCRCPQRLGNFGWMMSVMTALIILLSNRLLPSVLAFSPGLATDTTSYRNSIDHEFPYRFEGRAFLRPALVRAPDAANNGDDYQTLSLFGWTLGGCVALEYDTSPAGIPYREFVVLKSLGWLGRGAIGQVGKALYVNETRALTMCEEVWNLPADSIRSMEFLEDGKDHDGKTLSVTTKCNQEGSTDSIQVSGWSTLRGSDIERNVQLPLLWTPKITGIWTDLLLSWLRPNPLKLDVHRLRVSGKAQLQWSGNTQLGSMQLLPLGVDLVLQAGVIEISHPIDHVAK